MNLFKFIQIGIHLLLLQATLAGAAQSPRYDVAYTWDADIQQVLDYRKKLPALLGLTIDKQLKIVGRGQEYGVVYMMNGTLGQAKETAEEHTQKLRRAGLQPAQPTKNSGDQSLYNVSYTMGPDLAILHQDYATIKSSLGAQVSAHLSIEKNDSRNFSIVYRCWASKSAALRFAKQHGTMLKKKKISASIIPAADRPIVPAGPGLLKETRRVPDQQGSRTVQSQAIFQHTTNKKTTALQFGITSNQLSTRTTEHNPSNLQAISPGTPAGLNSRMDVFLQDQKKKGRIQQQERTAWVVYDLTNNNYLLSINSNRSFQAASMIKPFVALAFFHQVEKGKLAYTPQHRHLMEAMIQQSNNAATNWFIRQVGGPARCEAILKREYNQIFKQVKVTEYIPPGGRTYQNSAQPSEYIQFLKALWNNQLPSSNEMLRLMSLPGRDRIFYGTDVPNGTLVYNKTGTTAHLCGDMGILAPRDKNGERIPYAIVGIVERPSSPADYKQWMHTSGGVIRDFSTLVYEEMKRKHNLL
ncbi:serine hydrolase [uncultured Desulfobulbus sp.]|uniref:serine hydrolase n=1 Tax=uncultured Desulfobulbus sp. TaxID=239745 RepID=UPI0029C6FB48|nr:serine hydrolase [uncultured Desulfobulbus sp.]